MCVNVCMVKIVVYCFVVDVMCKVVFLVVVVVVAATSLVVVEEVFARDV